MENQNLTELIQIRVNKKEKAFIQLIAKKHDNKDVSALIISLLYSELNRFSTFDMEIKEVQKNLMRGDLV